MSSTPKKSPKTAEESAIEIRQRSLLDKEIEENEERFKAMARGKLGSSSLLSGAASSRSGSASPRARSSSGVSILSTGVAGGTGGGTGGGGDTPRSGLGMGSAK